MEVVTFVRHYVEMLNNPVARVLNVTRSNPIPKWRCPEPEVIKLNFDASVNVALGSVGIGIMARSHTGECVGWSSHFLLQSLDPTSAEAKAAYYAMIFAREKGWRKIIVEGDSSTVISSINGATEDRSMHGAIIADILVAKGWFDGFSARHINRKGNQVAHEVARLSLKGPNLLPNLPLVIQNIVNFEAED
ncbi:PREDICTED: uncharacterized protein LOC105970477 [Erythranthe guttata]|uniref:uncharacterized protein LOC105970477 n=1 Tax=Erythranthe guttata TaxID=4155 RepID=UPI00064D9159|nr:PREDICTED: uncharacterized protein LOC105970477 [Erythranthe guttata]|eukprot:XP_012850757.1 PREDICTED: uncharacterized protein LOC105970477 [Erythranthe guttata]